MKQALHAEWTKLRTLPGTIWLLLTAAVVTVAIGAGVAAATTCQAAGCSQDPAKITFAGINLSQAVVAILAVLAVSSEYSTGMIRVTLTAMPRRITMLTAKAITATALVVTAGTAGVLASAIAGQLILPGHGFTLAHGYQSLTSAADLRAAAGSVLYLALIGLLATGAAAALRDSAVAIGAVLGLLYLFPVIAGALGPGWSRHLQQIGPMSAGLYIQATTDLRSLPLTPWQGLGVLALWAAGTFTLGGLLLHHRDA